MAYVYDTQSRVSHWLAHRAKQDFEFRSLLRSIASGNTVEPQQSKQLDKFRLYLKEHRHLAGLNVVDLDGVNPRWSEDSYGPRSAWAHVSCETRLSQRG